MAASRAGGACVDAGMRSGAKISDDAVHPEKPRLLILYSYFLFVPVLISLFETLLQFPVTSKSSILVSLAFAMAFTIPGTFLAWLATMLLARAPGARSLGLPLLLVAGYAANILVFSPFYRLVYEAASQVLPYMREVTIMRHHSSGWPQVTAFLMANLPAVLVWTAMNMYFIDRFGFPAFGLGDDDRKSTFAPAADAPLGHQLPDFCRALSIGDLSALWSISAEEHYLRLTGTFGVRVIRHSFNSALEQLPPALCLQVHRSHWVAFGRVARIAAGKDVQLVLPDGTMIPVSKSYRRAVQLVEASLLAG